MRTSHLHTIYESKAGRAKYLALAIGGLIGLCPAQPASAQATHIVRLEVTPGHAVVQLVEPALLARLPRRPSKVSYAHSLSSALAAVKPGRITAALLPAVELDHVVEVVRAGGLLPEKATSFQPKPSLGSFIRLLDE